MADGASGTSDAISASTSVTVSRVIRSRSRYFRELSNRADTDASSASRSSTRTRAAASRASNSSNSEPISSPPPPPR